VKPFKFDTTKLKWKEDWHTILLGFFLILLFYGLPRAFRYFLIFFFWLCLLYVALWFVTIVTGGAHG
jgi:hypothetical protein